MKLAERKLFKILAEKEQAMSELKAKFDPKIELAKKQLAEAGCTHPEIGHVRFTWFWYSSIGEQVERIGIRCTLCGLERRWNSSNACQIKKTIYWIETNDNL